MPKCPNCGLETQRTEDWACQWCGYPLTSPAFKKIDKTWRQIKEERGEGISEPERPAVPPKPAEDIPRPVPEGKAKPGARNAPPSRLVREPPAEETEVEPEPPPAVEPEAEPQPVASVEPPAIEPEPEAAAEPVPEPVARVEAEPAPAPERKPEPVVENALALTVDELLSAYMVDDVAAHERFTNKLLRVTGLVGKVMVNDMRAVYSVFLTSAEIAGFRDVECRFTRQYASEISQLKAGQSVTIQGRYFGYVISIILRNCVLVP